MSASDTTPAGTADLHESRARAAFDEARAQLGAHRLDRPRRSLPLAYQAPVAPDTTAGSSPGSGRQGGPGSPAAIGALVDAQRRGEITAEDLLDQVLARVAELDPALGGIVEMDEERARRDARALDQRRRQGHALGPLHGAVMTVKDVIDVAGMATRAGSAAYLDHPDHDAPSVARLRAAGAVVLAKTATHEFALGVTTPQSRNPHAPTRIPGGSSGGSAIAVATGMGHASLGTDTRASIRVPAALSGVVGFKGRFGAVPTEGVVTLSWTMDHVAPMASTVADVALLYDVLTGEGAGLAHAAGRPVAGVRIGIPEACWRGSQPDVERAARRAVEGLAASGAVVGPASAPTSAQLDAASSVGLVISRCEAATFHRELGTDLDACWTEVADQLREAATIPAVDYLAAQRWRAELRDQLLAPFDQLDLLAMPTSPVVAPPVADFADFLMVLARNAIPWSLVGCPAISVPCGADADGLPVGLQLVGPPGREPELLAAAAAVTSV